MPTDKDTSKERSKAAGQEPGSTAPEQSDTVPELNSAAPEPNLCCYCLFCNTQKAGAIAEIFQHEGTVRALSPRIVQRKWVKGRALEEEHSYLPGYVFLYSDHPIEKFYRLYHIPGVLRILGNRDEDYLLSGSDLAFAKMLASMNGVIGILKAYQEGDLVKLDREVFGDFEGRIVKFDRSRKRAQIEFDFDGRKQNVWCGVDMIRPDGE